KYECVYLRDLENGIQARDWIGAWLRLYNEERPHSSLSNDRTPMEEYQLQKAA
ncbi:transposase, partial [bacterium]|nr:transposase [bacterium]MBM4118040.1 transposase [bacterium]